MHNTYFYRLFRRNEFEKNEESYQDKKEREKKAKETWAKVKKDKKKALLNADIYDTVYYSDERENYYFPNPQVILLPTKKAFDDNDIYSLEQILEWLREPTKSRLVPFICEDILNMEIFKDKQDGLIEYLSLIKNNREATIIYDSIDLWIKNYKHLKCGYNEAKKQKTRWRKSTMTFEHRLRVERHYLEKELQKTGTGLNRAKKLSQILLLVN